MILLYYTLCNGALQFLTLNMTLYLYSPAFVSQSVHCKTKTNQRGAKSLCLLCCSQIKMARPSTPPMKRSFDWWPCTNRCYWALIIQMLHQRSASLMSWAMTAGNSLQTSVRVWPLNCCRQEVVLLSFKKCAHSTFHYSPFTVSEMNENLNFCVVSLPHIY